jgi:hypothetical protein
MAIAQGDVLVAGTTPPAGGARVGLLFVVVSGAIVGGWDTFSLSNEPDLLHMTDADALALQLTPIAAPASLPPVGSSIQLCPTNRAVVSPDWKAWRVLFYGTQGATTWMILQDVNDPTNMRALASTAVLGVDYEVLASP